MKNKKSLMIAKVMVFIGTFLAMFCLLNKIIPGIIVGVVLVVLAIGLASVKNKKDKNNKEE